MLALSDGLIQPTPSVQKHLDLCLDCRGCETACPSGVVYHELIEETRSKLSHRPDAPKQGWMMRWMFAHVLTHPTRLKFALMGARVFRGLGLFGLLSTSLQKMGQMIPADAKWWPRRLPEAIYSKILPKTRVNFFPGCVGSVMYADVNRKAVELLAASGADVKVPRNQVCCGAVHLHNGDHAAAIKLARRNIDALSNAPQIATTIAGCGAMLREYGHLLRDDPQYKDRAKSFSGKVRDINEVLVELGPAAMSFPVHSSVTYHDACHLAHAQGVTSAPRKLLAKVPGLNLVPLPESDICCGAAGTYNLTEPEMAGQLADRKLRNIESTGCEVCVAGNVGCSMHIQAQAAQQGKKLKILHPVEVLYRAVFGKD